MIAFLVRRFLWMIVTLLVITSVSWFMIRWAPGDPFNDELRAVDPAVRTQLEREYRLDKTIPQQYFYWLKDIFTEGKLGRSMKSRDKTVNEIIAQSLPVSLALGSLSLLIAVYLGLATGLIAGARQNTVWDYSSMSMAILGISLPSFVLASGLIWVFAFELDWFPAAGWSKLKQVILPAIALALPYAAYISRLTRVGLLEVIGQDYIRTAEAKGLAEHVVIIKHALRGAILPVVSFMGPAAASIAVGSLVVEKIFFIPGLGQFFVKGAINRDYYLVMGTVLVYSMLLYVFNILVDMAYVALDPRVNFETE
ncbi:MAG: ABC transporter permease subunit [Planctomycetota bacterium]|nr:ABC transporter permease subunit [Planctomycetota bacterium]